MKNLKNFHLFLFLTAFCFSTPLASAQKKHELNRYEPDFLGQNFVQKTISMPADYEGEVVCTLIKRELSTNSPYGVLYVHGYNDYFFQTEMAERFTKEGFRFYALDLRKYGRSYRPHQYPFQVRDLSEYFADIDTAISLMRSEGCHKIILMGHSTGGLITSLYCDSKKHNLEIEALILNSPFLDMNQPKFYEKVLIPMVSFWGKIFPDQVIKSGNMSSAYAESLLKNHHGEWEFDTLMKYPRAPYLTASWIHAIHSGQKQVKKGLEIYCPVLVMHSHQSVYGDVWTPLHQQGDAVLDVEDIRKYGETLGKDVKDITVHSGLHDLALSNPKSRNVFYKEIFRFLASVLQ